MTRTRKTALIATLLIASLGACTLNVSDQRYSGDASYKIGWTVGTYR